MQAFFLSCRALVTHRVSHFSGGAGTAQPGWEGVSSVSAVGALSGIVLVWAAQLASRQGFACSGRGYCLNWGKSLSSCLTLSLHPWLHTKSPMYTKENYERKVRQPTIREGHVWPARRRWKNVKISVVKPIHGLVIKSSFP